MLEIYLPIAQVNIDIFLLLFLSLAVGVLSGLFGVGGGFLMTPFLIFMGIPPVYAVPNEVNNILATSVSGSLTHWYKKTLDYKMGLMIVSGGVVGTIIGIMTFTFFFRNRKNKFDNFFIIYVSFSNSWYVNVDRGDKRKKSFKI